MGVQDPDCGQLPAAPGSLKAQTGQKGYGCVCIRVCVCLPQQDKFLGAPDPTVLESTGTELLDT